MKSSYVLITPAYNEEANIERLINSIISQTITPKKWIIVNDGSTDQTKQIIAEYESRYDFIKCYSLQRNDVISYYNRKTQVFLEGYKALDCNIDYDFLGSLDADISLNPTYYQNIMNMFDSSPKLGVAGGTYVYDIKGRTQNVLIDKSCVPGSVQMFRRKCYEQIGGYIPLKHGGDDTLVCIMARMYGWETISFPQYKVIQHREVGTTGGKSILKARFVQGLTEYGVATHPLFMFSKSLRRAFMEKPYFLGAASRMAGFLSGYIRREPRVISKEVKNYVRKEQMNRLCKVFCK